MLWASASKAVRLPCTANNNLKWKIEQDGINGTYAVGQVNGKGSVHPDEVIAYEAGARVTPSRNLSVELSVFHNQYLHVMDLTSNKGGAVLLNSPIVHYLYDIEFTDMYEGQSYGKSGNICCR